MGFHKWSEIIAYTKNPLHERQNQSSEIIKLIDLIGINWYTNWLGIRLKKS